MDSASDAVIQTIQNMDVLGTQVQPQQQPAQGRAGQQKIKINSLYNQFTTQLSSLMTRLLESEAHFVKCIKPNAKLQVGNFDSPFVMG